MTLKPRSDLATTIGIVFGILVGTMGIFLHWILPDRYEKIEMVPIFVGGAIAIYCAYWKNPKRADLAAKGATRVGHEVVDIMHAHRRADDPQAEVPKTDPPTAVVVTPPKEEE